MSYVQPKEASKFYNVTSTTLQNWAKQGKIEYKCLDSGHRRYKIIKPEEEIVETERNSYIYCRVSSVKQISDLHRQVKVMRKKYPTYKLIMDIGSGLNYKRKGFIKILEQVMQNNVERVMVAHRDRWIRFGYEFYEWLFEQFNTELISEDSSEVKSKSQELTEDLMSIMGIFNARYNGSRKYDSQKDKNISTGSNETEIAIDV